MSSCLRAETIEKINLYGNERISLETIKVYGEIEIGKEFSNEDINNVLKNLYETNFFENISVAIKGNSLEIFVKEYPIINSLEIVGENSKNIKNLLIERLSLKSKEAFIENKLNNDTQLIKKIYSSLGYNFASVNVKVEKFSENRINLLYTIDKKNKTYIEQIEFIGDKKISDSKLRNIIVSEEYKFWKFLSKNTFLNLSNIELDKRLLTNYYKSLGFYDVRVLSNQAEIDKNNLGKLIYTIQAGNRYKINKISTNISNVIEKKIFESLQNTYTDLVGKYYSPFKVKKLLDEVDLIISNNDLQFIEHSVNEIVDNESIDIIVNIYEGDKSIVEKINIQGNTVTDESVVRSELLIDEGDPFNKLNLDKSIAKLKSRNIFGEIETNISNSSKPNQKIIDIKVEEKPTGEISAGAGIGTSGGSLSFSVSENNWLGKGINISTNLDLNSETFSGGFFLTDPNYKFSGNSLTYYVSNTKNDKPDSGFKNNIISTGIGTKFEQYKDIYLSPNISFSYDDLKVENTASSALKKQKGTFSDISFDYAITSDKRDRAYGPTDGHILTFSQALPIYADAPFIKNSISLSKYHSFNPNLTAAFKFYAAGVNGLKNEDVRLSKRVFLSSNRLRGFENGKVGPKDGVDFVGGNYASAVNFEINLPNLIPESLKTDVGLFLDIGNVWHVDYADNIDDSNKIRSTAGIATNWLSPVGPMSFILSQNISKKDTDITESFNFLLGTTF